MDDCNLEKTPVLEDLGRYIEAGELRAVAGDTIDAIRLFILGGDQDRAAQCLCDALWEQMPYGTTVTDLNAERLRALEEVSTGINVATAQLKNEVRNPFLQFRYHCNLRMVFVSLTCSAHYWPETALLSEYCPKFSVVATVPGKKLQHCGVWTICRSRNKRLTR